MTRSGLSILDTHIAKLERRRLRLLDQLARCEDHLSGSRALRQFVTQDTRAKSPAAIIPFRLAAR